MEQASGSKKSKASHFKPQHLHESLPIQVIIPSATEILETDLPILSNVSEVRVVHYLMKFEFNFEARLVNGSQIIFVQPVNLNNCNAGSACPSKIVLDCCSINVLKVSVLKFKEGAEDKDYHLRNNLKWFELEEEESKIIFELDKWSLTLSNWPSCLLGKCQFPLVLRIDYETLPSTPSLHWRPTNGFNYELDASKSVYTPASPVNNRGLFPCQEHPSAMSTWECYVLVKKPFIPLLSSDEPGQLISESSEMATYYFRTQHILPMSTFAIVIGIFSICAKNVVELEPFYNNPESSIEIDSILPVRLFSLHSEVTWSNFSADFQEYTRNVLISAHKILGPHPFSRLDIVIMPRCFHTLSLANPHMIFVSGSVFAGIKEPLYYSSLPHEIGHSWFGLSIGALDWTEEWLSEGFATFVEDIIYKEAMEFTYPESSASIESDIALKACVRLHKLQNELRNSSETNLQKLVQNVEPAGSQAEEAKVIKNGLVPLKQFTQVHYLKGYFFLHYLSQLVGFDQFLIFLKEYVSRFRGKLVTSMEFLHYYQQHFDSSLKLNPGFESVPKLMEDWLQNPNLLEPLSSVDILNDTEPNVCMNYDCSEPLRRISKVFQQLSVKTERITEKLNASELIILFEKILSSPRSWFISITLQDLQTRLSFQALEHNPEVQHRFCEIILKFYILSSRKSKRARLSCPVNYRWEMDFLRTFLLQHPAMGVYLYGELMISENKTLQEMARSLYLQQLEVLDPEALQVIHSMIY